MGRFYEILKNNTLKNPLFLAPLQNEQKLIEIDKQMLFSSDETITSIYLGCGLFLIDWVFVITNKKIHALIDKDYFTYTFNEVEIQSVLFGQSIIKVTKRDTTKLYNSYLAWEQNDYLLTSNFKVFNVSPPNGKSKGKFELKLCDSLFSKNVERTPNKVFDYHFFALVVTGAGLFFNNGILISFGIVDNKVYLLSESNSDNPPLVDLIEYGIEKFYLTQFLGSILITFDYSLFWKVPSNRQIMFDYDESTLKIIFNWFEEYKLSSTYNTNLKNVNYQLNSSFYPSSTFKDFKIIDQNSIEESIKDKIKNRIGRLNITNNLLYIDTIHKHSIEELNKILSELGFNDYGFVDITRSSRSDLIPGNYIYQIDETNSLLLFKNPLKVCIGSSGEGYAIFDAAAYEDSVKKLLKIDANKIRDFQMFGTELMINNVTTFTKNEIHGTIDHPKLLGTAFREILFGQSYASLKGMSTMLQQLNQTIIASKVNIKTISEIKDTRVIQVIFHDNTDIELKGIQVYYDFNRKMGNVKNKSTNIDTTIKTTLNDSVDQLSRLKQYKQMLLDGLIDEDEYKNLKNKLLGL
jgi:hypothetical protein